jgi:hypothetical protein
VEELLLLQEKKIAEILGGQVDPRLEASGVLAKDGFFYVIFDNLADIAYGQMIYCTIEGVSWITPNRIVVVSDKAESKQGKWCRDKDQSIHIFEIPANS